MVCRGSGYRGRGYTFWLHNSRPPPITYGDADGDGDGDGGGDGGGVAIVMTMTMRMRMTRASCLQ